MDDQQIPVARQIEPPKQPQTPTPAETASGRALAALILGILSIVCMGFVAGIPAIIIGHMEIRDIKAGKASKAGEGIAKVGLILGIIGTALTCLVTLAGILMVFIGISAGVMEGIKQAAVSI